jgi:hypothetical protein
MTLRVIDILGVALLLGLVLRYGMEATQLIGAGTAAVSQTFNTAALVGAGAPPLRGV